MVVAKVPYKAKAEQSLQDILSSHGLEYQSLAESPPEILREVQRRPVFEDFRSIELPELVLRDSLVKPILKKLSVTRVGSCAHAAGHYIPRPKGSLDCILHYCVAGKGWCEISGWRWEISVGNVLLVPAKIPHEYGASEEDPWSIHWLHFRGKTALEFCNLLQVSEEQPVFQLPLDHEVLSCFDEIYEWMGMIHNYDHLVAASGTLGRFLSLANLKRYSINQ